MGMVTDDSSRVPGAPGAPLITLPPFNKHFEGEAT